MTREGWLNGWHRPEGLAGSVIVMGSWVRCAGCGADRGITCVVIEDGWEPPPEPAWPFDADNCPVCLLRDLPPPEPPAWPRGKRRPLP